MNWRLDETDSHVKGAWRSWYRAGETQGHTIDLLLTAPRDQEVALRFLKQAIRRHGGPEKNTIAGSAANAAAIRGDKEAYRAAIIIRQIKDLHHVVAQDHRGVKRSTRPRLGCKSVDAAPQTLAGVELIPRLK
jgi:putative transposase